MQNKLYTMQFFSPPYNRSVASPQAEIIDPLDFHEFHEIPEKVQVPRQERIWTPGKSKKQ